MNGLNLSQDRRLLLTAIAALVFTLVGNSSAHAQAKYKPGDRVQCNTIGSSEPKYEKFYEPGTVLAFRDGDQPDGSWYRVKADSNKVEYYCKIEHIRPIASAATNAPNKAGTPVGTRSQATTETNEVLAKGDFIECPVKQKQVKNGARPDAELFKKIIRCKKGEKAVEEGDEGAVSVEISTIQIGAARPWRYSQDLGNGKAGTLVYPVKATYTVKTFYRTATEVEQGWIRILNFYVNAFGEWQIGSEENVKSPQVKRIQK
jgi:hypothetical protein